MVTDVEQEVERYMALPYRIEMKPCDWGWYVKIPDLPGCMSQGETPEEAIEMIRDAQRLWLQVALEDGRPVPQPSDEDNDNYSGRFNVRVPKSLHAALASEAEAEGVSLNQLVVAKLAMRLQVR